MLVRQNQRQRHKMLFHVGFAIAIGGVMAWLVWSIIASPNHWLHSLFLPASMVLAVGLCVLRNQQQWASPTRQMVRLLEEIRIGAAPIEELSQIENGPAPLVPVLQNILRDLRQQKAAVVELNEEVRQRIASRTHALERQIGSLKQQATRDGLTGLFNRRMFDTYLPRIQERCLAEKLDMSILMIDVDNFKKLNDTLGHATGDELLRDVAQIIRSGVREQDAPFRLGGDEFVVILPGVANEEATEISRRLIELVDALVKPLKLEIPPRLSIGVANLNDLKTPTPQALVELADKRLYEVKAVRKHPRVTQAAEKAA